MFEARDRVVIHQTMPLSETGSIGLRLEYEGPITGATLRHIATVLDAIYAVERDVKRMQS